MSKKILVMMLIIISAISFVKQPNLNVMADEKAKIEIWSESLNERIEHRSIEVGNSNPNFSIKVTPSDTTIENVTWVTENIGVATVEGNNSTATVYGVSEGSTKLVLSALTKKYGIINYRKKEAMRCIRPVRPRSPPSASGKWWNAWWT